MVGKIFAGMLSGVALFGSGNIGDYVKLALDIGRIFGGAQDDNSPMAIFSRFVGNKDAADTSIGQETEGTPEARNFGMTRAQQQQLALTVGLFAARKGLDTWRNSRKTPDDTIDALSGRDLADAIENFGATGGVDKDGKRAKKRRLSSEDIRRIALEKADRLIELQERLSRDNMKLLKRTKLDSAANVVAVTDSDGEIISSVPIEKEIDTKRGGSLLWLGLLAGAGALVATLNEEQRAALLKNVSSVPSEVMSLVNEFRGKPYSTDYEQKAG